MEGTVQLYPYLFLYFLSGLECAGHSFAYVALFYFWEMSAGYELRELPQQADALPT
jgi:hypothetical protein